MSNAEYYYDLFSKWEEEKITESQIIDRCVKIIAKDIHNTEEYYDINDALKWKGYSYQFSLPRCERETFDPVEYSEIVSQCSKSNQKTLDLLTYLQEMGDWRLTLNSLHFIKLSRLFDLQIFDPDDSFKNEFGKMNLYDFYMSLFSSKYSEFRDIKIIFEEFLESIGLRFVRMEYMQFRMSMEYLLWTITCQDKSKDAYQKVNSIKLAFSICPREYFLINDKKYYNEKIHKNLVKFLSLVDRKEIKRIKEAYGDDIDYNNGYKLLYNML